MSSPPPPVTLKLWDEQGNEHSWVLPGPGGQIRLAVGRAGCRSGTWKIFASRNTSDVYIVIREIGGTQKWSLHESGDWRFQWVTRDMAMEFAQTEDRVIDKWPQPPELGQTGWTKGFLIHVRDQDIVPIADDDDANLADVVWLPPPGEGNALAIHVIIARPNNVQVELQNVLPFDAFTLADGRVVILTASVEQITDEQNQVLDNACAAVLAQAPPGFDPNTVEAPRMLVVAHVSDGTRSVWDTALK
jgi:hypothetical protein